MLSKMEVLRFPMEDRSQMKRLSWTDGETTYGCPLKGLASVDLSCGCLLVVPLSSTGRRCDIKC